MRETHLQRPRGILDEMGEAIVRYRLSPIFMPPDLN
jgi:hypothetical protein